MVTLIVTLVAIALISIIITSMYYNCQNEHRKKVKVTSDDDDFTRRLIIMHRNPAYVSSDERDEVANCAYISSKKQHT